MTILAQALLSLVSGHLMTLTLLSTGQMCFLSSYDSVFSGIVSFYNEFESSSLKVNKIGRLNISIQLAPQTHRKSPEQL
jgi:hypothetical protein